MSIKQSGRCSTKISQRRQSGVSSEARALPTTAGPVDTPKTFGGHGVMGSLPAFPVASTKGPAVSTVRILCSVRRFRGVGLAGLRVLLALCLPLLHSDQMLAGA